MQLKKVIIIIIIITMHVFNFIKKKDNRKSLDSFEFTGCYNVLTKKKNEKKKKKQKQKNDELQQHSLLREATYAASLQ